jgi:hypothetical protein
MIVELILKIISFAVLEKVQKGKDIADGAGVGFHNF